MWRRVTSDRTRLFELSALHRARSIGSGWPPFGMTPTKEPKLAEFKRQQCPKKNGKEPGLMPMGNLLSEDSRTMMREGVLSNPLPSYLHLRQSPASLLGWLNS